MLLKIENIFTYLENPTDEDEKFIDQTLSFESKGAKFTPSYQVGIWDGRVRFYNWSKKRFLTGLLNLVLKKGVKAQVSIATNDTRLKPPQTPLECPPWLDPIRGQPQALLACLASPRGIVQAATGMGKTVVISSLVHVLQIPWLVIVHKKDLLHQTAKQIEKFTGEPCGVIGDALWSTKRVTVCTVQTLHRSLRSKRTRILLGSVKGVIVDEVHNSSAKGYQQVLCNLGNAYYRFGFSGTPFGNDDIKNLNVVSVTGPVIYKMTSETLVDAGVLSKPEIKFYKVLQSKIPGQTWQQVYKNGIVDSEIRNNVVVEACKTVSKPALLCVKEVNHGKILKDKLQALGITTDFIWGEDESSIRQEAVKRLKRGEIEILIVSTIFDEGVDIPEVAGVVVASGGNSPMRAIQRLGRGMRTTDTKKEMQLIDFQDFGQRWLEKHSKQRIEIYQSEGFEVDIIP